MNLHFNKKQQHRRFIKNPTDNSLHCICADQADFDNLMNILKCVDDSLTATVQNTDDGLHVRFGREAENAVRFNSYPIIIPAFHRNDQGDLCYVSDNPDDTFQGAETNFIADILDQHDIKNVVKFHRNLQPNVTEIVVPREHTEDLKALDFRIPTPKFTPLGDQLVTTVHNLITATHIMERLRSDGAEQKDVSFEPVGVPYNGYRVSILANKAQVVRNAGYEIGEALYKGGESRRGC